MYFIRITQYAERSTKYEIMKLLLHTCCAPCALALLNETKRDHCETTGFFYNPNIQPSFEYSKRKNEAEAFFRSLNLNFVSPEYDARDFFSGIGGSGDTAERCRTCWDLRIRATCRFAEVHNFDAFTTTLLASPYQDHAILKGICEKVSTEKKTRFYYRDFRRGFKDAHRVARERGMYCQNYCGCIFSMVEREETKKLSAISHRPSAKRRKQKAQG